MSRVLFVCIQNAGRSQMAAALLAREKARALLQEERPETEVFRLLARGMSNAEIARRTGTSRPTVVDWRARYVAGGVRAERLLVVDEAE